MTPRTFALILLAGCGGESPADAPTWHADIAPMVDRHCVSCHAGEGPGPFDFRDLAVVRQYGEFMAQRIESREMPPPAADPNCHDYQGSEVYWVDDADIARFRDWVDAEMPEGDPADAPAPVETAEPLNPDLTLTMSAPYPPDYASDGNEYRCFPLVHDHDEPFYITGLEPVVGDPRVVHHIVLYKEPASAHADADPAKGWPCTGTSGDALEGMLAGWAPGGGPVTFPDGYGLEVKPDERLVIQMHYYYAGPQVEGAEDQSGYAFRTASAVDHPVIMVPYGGYDFVIPPNRSSVDYVSRQDIPDYYPEIPILGVFPHMHVLGKSYKLEIRRGDEDICVSDAPKYDFYNQLSYMFKEPLALEGGDKVKFTCVWDNSAESPNRLGDNPPQTVTFGEGTNDEMCFAFTYLAPPILP